MSQSEELSTAFSEDKDFSVEFSVANLNPKFTDDSISPLTLSRQMHSLMTTVTNIGVDVLVLRKEFDEVLERNKKLETAITGLKQVIQEKGILNLDDFDLACDVLENKQPSQRPTKNQSFN